MATKSAQNTVGDYVTLQRGNTYSGKLVGEPGPALLGLGSIEPGGGFRHGKYKSFGGDCPQKIMLRPGDLYVALKGATKDGSMVGSIARLPATVSSGRLTQDTARLDFLDKNPEIANHLYWILRTPQYRQYCESRVTGSAAASFSREDFLSYPVPPITSTSKTLVSIFEDVEMKVELNRRMNATLGAMVRALFKDWFVDFGPTRAKMEGRTPYLAPHLWALFPNQLDDEGKPKGWESKPLDQIAHFLNGLALQKYPATGNAYLPVIKIAELRAGNTLNSDKASPDIPTPHVIDDGDVLFSWSGSLLHRVWTGGRGALNQHLFKVTSADFPKWFFFHWIGHYMEDFQATAASKATTMGHIQRHHLAEALAVVPDAPVMQAADKVIGPLFERELANELESRKLAQTRDRLLSELMSGQIRVSAVETLANQEAQA
jgi:type I restriction enzyme S subunit